MRRVALVVVMADVVSYGHEDGALLFPVHFLTQVEHRRFDVGLGLEKGVKRQRHHLPNYEVFPQELTVPFRRRTVQDGVVNHSNEVSAVRQQVPVICSTFQCWIACRFA